MPNNRYVNSAKREILLKKEFEDAGWYAVRTAGSHGPADVIAIRPVKKCTNPAHYEVKFLQVKTSQSIKEEKVSWQAEDSPCGLVNIEYRFYPVKNAKYRELAKKRKLKSKK